jgi:hypothetical protein
MGVRTTKERLAEVKAKRQRTKKRMEQYDEEIKQLEKKDAEETRKHRTHLLIVCGAELAALFGEPLEKNKIHAVVNFLREQIAVGNFALENTEKATDNELETEIEKTRDSNEELFGGIFDF